VVEKLDDDQTNQTKDERGDGRFVVFGLLRDSSNRTPPTNHDHADPDFGTLRVSPMRRGPGLGAKLAAAFGA
jgi:hypothetical protein